MEDAQQVVDNEGNAREKLQLQRAPSSRFNWMHTMNQVSSRCGFTTSDDESDVPDAAKVARKTRQQQRKEMRESLLSKIETDITGIEEKIESSQLELDMRREAGTCIAEQNKAEATQLEELLQNRKWAYEKVLHKDMARRNSLHAYVRTVRQISGPSSNYVQTTEAQTIQRMHNYVVIRNQLKLQQIQAIALSKDMRAVKREQEEEKTLLKKNLLERKFEIESDTRRVKEHCENILEKQKSTLQQLDTKTWTKEQLMEDTSSSPRDVSHRRRPRRRSSISYSETMMKQNRHAFLNDIVDDSDDDGGVLTSVLPTEVEAVESRRPRRRSSLTHAPYGRVKVDRKYVWNDNSANKDATTVDTVIPLNDDDEGSVEGLIHVMGDTVTAATSVAAVSTAGRLDDASPEEPELQLKYIDIPEKEFLSIEDWEDFAASSSEVEAPIISEPVQSQGRHCGSEGSAMGYGV